MQKAFYLSLILIICLFCALIQGAEAADKTKSQVKLMRTDFRVTGASCVVCLRKVAQKLKASPGVIKADVSIFPPFGGLIIYDGQKTNAENVFKAAYDEHVGFADVDTETISQVPAVLLPKIMPSSKVQVPRDEVR